MSLPLPLPLLPHHCHREHHLPYQLSAEAQKEVLLCLRRLFSELAHFDTLLAPKLRKFLVDANRTPIDERTTRTVVERYYDTRAFSREEKASLRVVFGTACTLVASLYPEHRRDFLTDVSQLLEEYPQFKQAQNDELQYLLHYRNYMHTAVKIIPAKQHKGRLLEIAARLEGSPRVYITGGGQTKATKRHVDIYEREGGVRKISRPKATKGEQRPTPSQAEQRSPADLSLDLDELTDLDLQDCDLDSVDWANYAQTDTWKSEMTCNGNGDMLRAMQLMDMMSMNEVMIREAPKADGAP